MARALLPVLLLLAAPARAGMGAYSPEKLKAFQDQGRTILIHFNSAGCGVCPAQLAVLEIMAKAPSPAPEILQASFTGAEDLRRGHDVATPSTLLLFKGPEAIGKAVGLASEADIWRFVNENRMRARFKPGPRPAKILPAKR